MTMISRKLSFPHTDGARYKASNGLVMPKLSLVFSKLTKVVLTGSFAFQASMEFSSSTWLRTGLLMSLNGFPNDEDDMTYFTRVTSQAHDNGFTYRRQGKSRLGLRQPQGTMPTASNRAKVWEARGVSHQWSTGILTSWLEKQKFEDISLMSQLTKGRGWLFRAKHASNSFCFAFENDKGENISISQHFHHAKAPQTDPDQSCGEIYGPHECLEYSKWQYGCL